MNTLTREATLELLEDLIVLDPPPLLVLPPGITVEEAPQFFFEQSLLHYQLELRRSKRSIRSLERSLADMSPGYTPEERTGIPLPIGPPEFIATRDALFQAERLAASLHKASATLSVQGPDLLKRHLQRLELSAHDVHGLPSTEDPARLCIALQPTSPEAWIDCFQPPEFTTPTVPPEFFPTPLPLREQPHPLSRDEHGMEVCA